MILYPVLAGEIAKRGIKKKAIAASINVCPRSLSNRLVGKVPFTWPEATTIQKQFFPDITMDQLFATAEHDKEE